jgi:hypothetical protein
VKGRWLNNRWIFNIYKVWTSIKSERKAVTSLLLKWTSFKLASFWYKLIFKEPIVTYCFMLHVWRNWQVFCKISSFKIFYKLTLYTIQIFIYYCYCARRLIRSRIIESAAYCNQILLAPSRINSTQNTSVNWIIRILLSLLCRPKVILISGRYFIIKLQAYLWKRFVRVTVEIFLL